jgi:ATP-dependent Clp protease adaptor protein ClpS
LERRVADTLTDEKTDLNLDFPSLWGAKFFNDDYTPMEFVILVLHQEFRLDLAAAEAVMIKVHEEGSAVVGSYTKDVAQTKVMTVQSQARHMGHPLQLEAVSV